MYVSKPKTELSVRDVSSTRDRILDMAKQISLRRKLWISLVLSLLLLILIYFQFRTQKTADTVTNSHMVPFELGFTSLFS